MKKAVTMLLAVILLLGSTCGCAKNGAADPAGDEDKFTVGFSVITLSIEYYADMKDAFIAQCEERDWDYIVTESGQDVEATLNDCIDLIQRGVDALVVASWYGDSMGEVLEQAEASGVPVYFVNTGGLNEADPWVSHVLANDLEVGYYAGVWTAQHFLGEGQDTVNYVSLTTASTVGRDRVDGYENGLRDGGLTVNKLNEYLGSTREDYLAAMEDALNAYPDIDLVYGISSVCNLGAFDAVDAANKEEQVVIVGWDNSAEDQEIIDMRSSFLGTVDVDPEYEMSICLDNVAAHTAGEEVERISTYYPYIYTADGYVTYEDIFPE